MQQVETLGWIAEALGGMLLQVVAPEGAMARLWSRITTDSRAAAPGDVFVALKGEKFDAHDFAAGAARQGAVAVVCEREVPGVAEAGAVQFVVKDSLAAYGRIAQVWRARFSLALTAVVGSNGKTTTTQMVAAILAERWGEGRFHATRGNFNNAVGVPRTLLGLAFEHRAAVIEAGMNHRGEMAPLADMIRPTIVLVTNAQREHQANLETVAECAFENGLMITALPEGGWAVYPADDPSADVWQSLALARGVRTVTYSFDPAVAADWQGTFEKGVLTATGPQGQKLSIALSIAGEHNARNALGAAAACLAQGIGIDVIERALAAFRALPGRGARETVKSSVGEFTLIDDAYNCNPDSAVASVKMLGMETAPRIFLFGDMAELGDRAPLWHAEVGAAAKAAGVDILWTAGPLSRNAAQAFGGDGGRAFDKRDELVAALRELPLAGATVTVKASNSSGFSKVVAALRAL